MGEIIKETKQHWGNRGNMMDVVLFGSTKAVSSLYYDMTGDNKLPYLAGGKSSCHLFRIHRGKEIKPPSHISTGAVATDEVME